MKKANLHFDQFPPSLRALELLEFVAAQPGELSLAEISTKMALSKSTIHRLANQLIHAGYLYREHNQRYFWIGSNLRNFSLSVIRNDFAYSSAREILSNFAEEVGETCNIASLDGTEIIYLQRIETRWPLRFSLDLDSRIPIHCCASGKLFLAMLPKNSQHKILRTLKLKAITEKTIVSESVLKKELKTISKQGYSLDNQEFIPGMVAIAYPIFNKKNEIRATLSIHSPTIRCKDAKELIRHIPQLKKVAQQVESVLSMS